MSECVVYDAILPADGECVPVPVGRAADDYADEASLRSYLKNLVPENSTDWQVLQSLVTRYSRLLDTACGVEDGFLDTAVETASIRIFNVSVESRLLKLPPHVFGSVEQVAMNGVEVDLTAIRDSRDGLWLAPSSRYHGCVCRGGRCDAAAIVYPVGGWFGEVQVSARWGFDEIRQDVTEAVLSTVAQAYRRRDPALTQALSLSGGQSFIYEQRTVAWKTVVEAEQRKRKWSDFSPA